MMSRSCRSAHCSSAARRSRASTAPVGKWWAGVVMTAAAPVASSASTSSPRVDRNGNRLEAGLLGNQAMLMSARVLDGELVDPWLRSQRHVSDRFWASPCRPATAQGRRRSPADPVQVLGEGAAQLGRPARVELAESRRRHPAPSRAQRALPVVARESRRGRADLVAGRRRSRSAERGPRETPGHHGSRRSPAPRRPGA